MAGGCAFSGNLQDPEALVLSGWSSVVLEVSVYVNEGQSVLILNVIVFGLAQLL